MFFKNKKEEIKPKREPKYKVGQEICIYFNPTNEFIKNKRILEISEEGNGYRYLIEVSNDKAYWHYESNLFTYPDNI